MIYTSNGYILDLATDNSYGSSDSSYAQTSIMQRFDKKIITRDGKLIDLSPITEAPYLASSTNMSCSTSDRLYGVASQDLAVGTRGKARALFSTF